MRILLVDDNADAAAVLVVALQILGHRVVACHSAPEALALIQRELPDLVISDIGMPCMDGHDLARAIRSDPALAHVYLVALTGWGQKEDRSRAVAAGFDEHFTKPISLDAIDALCGRIAVAARRHDE